MQIDDDWRLKAVESGTRPSGAEVSAAVGYHYRRCPRAGTMAVLPYGVDQFSYRLRTSFPQGTNDCGSGCRLTLTSPPLKFSKRFSPCRFLEETPFCRPLTQV
jgi:hypothetical protein